MPSPGEPGQVMVTVDIDWAGEAAIERTLTWFLDRDVPLTIFSTHPSPAVGRLLGRCEVGLHPYFGRGSSHGETVQDVVEAVTDLPHNLRAFRCHRFEVSNTSREALLEAGMTVSSNVCTDRTVLPPFVDRVGLLEVPIYLEDGGYLFRRHPLDVDDSTVSAVATPGLKVIVVHPMHFVLNTPRFEYMVGVKRGLSRREWNALSARRLDGLRWRERGIGDFVRDLVVAARQSGQLLVSLSEVAAWSGRSVWTDSFKARRRAAPVRA